MMIHFLPLSAGWRGLGGEVNQRNIRANFLKSNRPAPTHSTVRTPHENLVAAAFGGWFQCSNRRRLGGDL